MALAEDLGRILHDWKDIDVTWIVGVVVVAALAMLAVQRLAPWLGRKLPDRLRLYVLPWLPVLRLLILVAAVVQLVPLVIRPTAENLFALFGAAAIAIGFAFKDLASSIIAGVVVLFEQPYRVGDWVKVDDAYGEIQTLGFRSLTMVTPDDTVVTVPHKKIWDSAIYDENSGARELQCVVHFYLHPEHDGEAVRSALWTVGVTSAYLQLDRPVVVIVSEEPWTTHYRLKAYPIESRDQFLFLSDLTVRGKAELSRLGARFVSSPIVDGSVGG